jgi:hypothetical protein
MPDTSIGGKLDVIQAVVDLGATAANLAIAKTAIDLTATAAGVTAAKNEVIAEFTSRDLPRKVTKEVAFTGAADHGEIGVVALFTVTGAVRIKLYAICTETLVGAGTLECGTPASTAGIIAQITNATQLLIGEIWTDASPTTVLEPDSQVPDVIVGDGADIQLTVGAANITDGTIVFVAEWNPLTATGALVAAA